MFRACVRRRVAQFGFRVCPWELFLSMPNSHLWLFLAVDASEGCRALKPGICLPE